MQEIDLSVLYDSDERTCIPLSSAGGFFPSQGGARSVGNELTIHIPVPHALSSLSDVRMLIDHS